MDFLLVLGQVLLGGFFVMNGVNHFTKLKGLTAYAISKKVPTPKVAVLLTGLLLILGGVGIVFDTYTTLALWFIIIFLVPTSFIMHPFWKEADPQTKTMEMTQFTKNMALVGAALILLF